MDVRREGAARRVLAHQWAIANPPTVAVSLTGTHMLDAVIGDHGAGMDLDADRRRDHAHRGLDRAARRGYHQRAASAAPADQPGHRRGRPCADPRRDQGLRVLPPLEPDRGQLHRPRDGWGLPGVPPPAVHQLERHHRAGRRRRVADLRERVGGGRHAARPVRALLLGHRHERDLRADHHRPRGSGRRRHSRLVRAATGQRQALLRRRHRQALLRRPGDEHRLRDPVACRPASRGQAPPSGADYDIVTHGTRVFSRRQEASTFGRLRRRRHRCGVLRLVRRRRSVLARNLVNRHNASGVADRSVRGEQRAESKCINDATPGTVDDRSARGRSSKTTTRCRRKRSSGRKTLFATRPRSDSAWAAGTGRPTRCAPAAAGPPGIVAIRRRRRRRCPPRTASTSDGTCAVGVGDPGQVFTMDVNGASPCTSLSAGTVRRSVDLRNAALRLDGRGRDLARRARARGQPRPRAWSSTRSS